MKYDYEDDVCLSVGDGKGNVVKNRCSVVAITPVETEEQAVVFHFPTGTVLYTVEFGDGSDTLVPEELLEPLPIGQE